MAKAKSKVKIPADLQTIGLDWKEFSSDAAEQFASSLAPFGIKMYADPTFAGSDSYCFFLTKAKLSEKQVAAISKQYWKEDLK